MEPGAVAYFQRWRTTSALPLSKEPGSPGWVTVQVQFDDEAQACFVVLGLGPKVDVIAPKSLRTRVADDHATAVARAAVASSP